MTKRIGFISLILAVFTQAASAQTLAVCGASSGYAYFPAVGLVTEDQSGWAEDGISDGGIMLLRDGDAYDIVYTDAVGGRSARADGFEVIGFPTSTGVLVLTMSSVTAETYHFDIENRQLAWTQNKFDAPINKVAAFVSDCE
ncbi:hypothetical protein [Pelagibacterium sp. H642]|uniref:hypothetical protein n=1 Tax=Pelagibacterium sp. H642 TaxID=1881069 RepID=UPI0028160E5B|nr:hypothetical protein [Pelagibacterium sp. H642]WMT90175.1 hypothetical protein NO934_15460 [Pelagibacterium sp. H642]